MLVSLVITTRAYHSVSVWLTALLNGCVSYHSEVYKKYIISNLKLYKTLGARKLKKENKHKTTKYETSCFFFHLSLKSPLINVAFTKPD